MIWMAKYHFKEVDIMMLILLIVVLIGYLVLLITRYKKKNNFKINGTIQIIQGIMWTLIAIDSCTTSHAVVRIAYIIIVLLSFIAGFQEFYKCK